MKRIIEQEVSFCDHCKKQTYVTACLHCGVEHCWDCKKRFGIEYTRLYFSDSGDGYYCTACDLKLSASSKDPIHNVYTLIKSLRNEESRWYSNFKVRVDNAEKELKRLLDKKE